VSDPRSIVQIAEDIRSYQPGDDWLGLHELLEELFGHPIEQIPPPCLLAIFERFPLHDGYGVFWSALHGLEDIPAYEPHLIASLRRQPSQFGLLMVRRILNSPDRNEAVVQQLRDTLLAITSRAHLHSDLLSEAEKLLHLSLLPPQKRQAGPSKT
jgi:hypothetical protein